MDGQILFLKPGTSTDRQPKPRSAPPSHSYLFRSSMKTGSRSTTFSKVCTGHLIDAMLMVMTPAFRFPFPRTFTHLWLRLPASEIGVDHCIHPQHPFLQQQCLEWVNMRLFAHPSPSNTLRIPNLRLLRNVPLPKNHSPPSSEHCSLASASMATDGCR